MSNVVRIQSKGNVQATPPAIPLFAQRDAALAELAAIEAAEAARVNAEQEANRKVSELKQKVAEIDRQTAESTAAALVREAAWEAESAPAALQALYSELNTAIDAIKAVLPYVATVQQISDRHTQMIGESIGASLASAPETGNWNMGVNNARSHAAKVLQQVATVPVTRNAAFKAWIKEAKNQQEQTYRVGIALACTGILFSDIPADYSASGESRELLRENAIPKF